MNHDRIIDQDLIGRYRAGSLAAEDAEAFEAHLIDCAECQRLLDSDLRLEQGLRTIAARAAVRSPTAASRWRRPVHRTLAAVAVLATVFAVPWLASSRLQPEPPASPADLPVFQLALTRGPDDAMTELIVPAGAPWYALELEAPAGAGPRCRVEIADAQGRPVWQGTAAIASDPGVVRVLLDRGFLTSGAYRITVHADAAGAPPSVEHRVRLHLDP